MTEKNSFKLFTLPQYEDHRGYFYESYSKNIADSLEQSFVQDNISFSKKGVLRGLHYQWQAPMGKLVQTIKGAIIDYIVNIQHGSKDYGKVQSFEISERNKNVLWVPSGFAHGFRALEDSYVLYKCTAYYNRNAEGAINFFDSDLNINADDEEGMIISEKDKNAQSFEEYTRNPKFMFEEIV